MGSDNFPEATQPPVSTPTTKRPRLTRLDKMKEALRSQVAVLLALLDPAAEMSEESHLYAVVVTPLETGQMQAITYVNISDSQVTQWHEFVAGEFRWGRKGVRSIAGRCATDFRCIMIPDLNNPNADFREDYVELDPPRPAAGILSVPIVDKAENKCLAVLSISTTERYFFQPQHLDLVRQFATQMRFGIAFLLDELEGCTRRPKRKTRTAKSPTASGKPAEQLWFRTKLDRIMEEVIEGLRENHRVKHPTKFEQVILRLMLDPNEVLTLDDLSPIFATTFDAEYSARNLIAKLNEKLEQYHVSLEHVPAYRIIPAPRKKARRLTKS